jgi:hypothetical protein
MDDLPGRQVMRHQHRHLCNPFFRCTCDFRQVATQRIVAQGFQ